MEAASSQGQLVQGMLNGPDGQITPWTKSPPLALLGCCSDLQTNQEATDLFPLSAVRLSRCCHGFLFPKPEFP